MMDDVFCMAYILSRDKMVFVVKKHVFYLFIYLFLIR